MANDFTTGTRVLTTEARSITLDEALLYVIEVNDQLARDTGLDLMSVTAAGIDSAAAVALVRRLGLSGRAYLKTSNGKTYVILKGYPGSRPVLNGTRYLRSNPAVAKLVLGSKDLAKGAARMTGLAIIAFTTLRVVEHILSDNDPRLSQLLGTVASDVVKFAGAATAGFLAGAAVGAVTTVVAGPVIAAVVVGIGVSIALDRLDRKFGLTQKLILAIEDVADSTGNFFDRIVREINAWERQLINRAIQESMRR